MTSTSRARSAAVRIRGRMRGGAERPPPATRPSVGDTGERWSACYAPHASMYLDQHGKVRACCQNTGTYLGDVTTQSLREIWTSASAERLRTALEHDDYSEGCDFCAWQVREGNAGIVYAKEFDYLRPPRRRSDWPRLLELSLTNTCNLQCGMCNGDWSSSIRSQREGRDPLPKVYGEDFFEQLAEILPHVEQVKFLGGEPFLGAEPLRVMEMLADLDHPPDVVVTTNATLHGPRVERLVEALEPSIVVSLDGASNATYDAVRVGAHFDDVLANIDRFLDRLGPDKVSITTCLMPQNWHEFADLLRIGEVRGLYVGVNVVRLPASHSLYQLDADELAEVVRVLDATEVDLTGQRLEMWMGHRAALAHRVEVIRAGRAEGPAHGIPGAAMDAPTRKVPDWLPFDDRSSTGAGAGRDEVDGPAAELSLDTSGRLDIERDELGFTDPLAGREGLNLDDLVVALETTFGPSEGWRSRWSAAPGADRFGLSLSGLDGRRWSLRVAARRDRRGRLLGERITLVVLR